MNTLKLKGGRIILSKYNPSTKLPWQKIHSLLYMMMNRIIYVTLNKTDVQQLINALTEVLQSFPSEKTNTH